MITLKEAAQTVADKYGLNSYPISTIRNWIKRGTLKAQKIGKKFYVDPNDLDQYLNENTQEFN